MENALGEVEGLPQVWLTSIVGVAHEEDGYHSKKVPAGVQA